MKVRLKAGCGSLTCPVAEGGDATLHPGDEAEVDRSVYYRYRHKLEALTSPEEDAASEKEKAAAKAALTETLPDGPVPHKTTQQSKSGSVTRNRKR